MVDCKNVGDGAKALLYLSRYLYRGVIQERDILRCEEAQNGQSGKVTFQYRDAKTGKMGRRTLAGEDFLWLVLQHVLALGPAQIAQLRRSASQQRGCHPRAASAAPARGGSQAAGANACDLALCLRPTHGGAAAAHAGTAAGDPR